MKLKESLENLPGIDTVVETLEQNSGMSRLEAIEYLNSMDIQQLDTVFPDSMAEELADGVWD